MGRGVRTRGGAGSEGEGRGGRTEGRGGRIVGKGEGGTRGGRL